MRHQRPEADHSPRLLTSGGPSGCTQYAHASNFARVRSNIFTTKRAGLLSKGAQATTRLAQPHAAPCLYWQLGWAVAINKTADAAGRSVFCMQDPQQLQTVREHRSLLQLCQGRERHPATSPPAQLLKPQAECGQPHCTYACTAPAKASTQPESEHGETVLLAPYHAQLKYSPDQ